MIDRVRDSTNEVGGRVLEMGGAEYMVRGLGYLRSLARPRERSRRHEERHAGARPRPGTVAFGPDIREGVAEWNGEGETVGGIVVMRYGMNALNVIDGVKQKLAEIKPSLPPASKIVSGYDRSGLIQASIETLQRDLLEEAIIVSLVIIVFLFHFRSALIPILTLPIAVLASFIPMYYLHVSSNIMSLGGLALAIGVLVDAAIVMVENGYRHLSERIAAAAASVSRAHGDGTAAHSAGCGEAGWPGHLLLAADHRRLVPAGVPARSAGRAHVPPAGLDQDSGRWLLFDAGHHAGAGADDDFHSRPSAAGIRKSGLALDAGALSAGPACCLRYRKTTLLLNLIFLVVTLPLALRIGSQFMPPLYEGSALYMPTALPGSPSPRLAAAAGAGPDHHSLSLRSKASSAPWAVPTAPPTTRRWTCTTPPSCSSRASSGVPGMTYEKLIQRDGREASISRPHEHLDDARPEPAGHGTDRHQDARGDQDPGPERRGHPASGRADCSRFLAAFPNCAPSSPSASRRAFTSMSKSTAPKRRAMG